MMGDLRERPKLFALIQKAIGNGELHARLVEQVNAHVHALSQDAESTNAAVRDSERALKDAQKARDVAVKDVDEKLWQTLIDDIGKVYAEHKNEISTLDPKAAKSIDDFVVLAKKVNTLGGQLSTIVGSLRSGWRPYLTGFAVLTFVAAVPFFKLVPGDIARWISLATALGSFAAAVAPSIRAISTILGETASFADKLDSVSQGALKSVLEKEEALRDASREAQARREAANRASLALARYVGPEGSANPPRLLRYMLEDDPDTKAMEAEIGLIGRARRLFEAVDAIVKVERKKRENGEASDLLVPDRIVLYIDDLDRCSYDQVYAVLQAIHLLLAFELFVVVVGIDVTWVQDAIAKQIDAAPVFAAISGNEEEVGRARRKRAIGYLEKIFQIPFWLRPLSTEGAKGGSYGEYVRTLLAQNLPPAKSDAAPGATGSNIFSPERDRAMDATAGVRPESFAAAQEPLASFVAPEEQFAAIEEALATVALTKEEVDFLAHPAIGKLAAKAPRGVKRLVNVYRIVRARMSEVDLQRLAGSDAAPPLYPLYALIAAIETGQPLEVADDLYTGMKDIPPDWTWSPEKRQAEALHQPYAKIHAQLQAQALADAFAAVESIRKGPITAKDYVDVGRQVRRYSFNKFV